MLWILLALTVIALLGAAAGLLRQPEAKTSPPPTLSALPDPNPAIEATWPDRAVSAGPTVLRDVAGRVLAVRPFTGGPVWCRLVVAGALVEDHPDDGGPVICVWVRVAVG
jgi:hypothetical protein